MWNEKMRWRNEPYEFAPQSIKAQLQLRELRALIKIEKGVFVTTSSFSQQAIDFAKHLSQRVILIDGARLTELMIEHNVGVRLSRALEFKRIDEDFFAEDDA
jgi:restriction endonuclease Mrr